MKRAKLFLGLCTIVAILAAAGCNGGGAALPSGGPQAPSSKAKASPIEHVVLIIQENRSFDDFFATFPGAGGATQGEEKVKKDGKWVDEPVTLQQQPLVFKHDFEHCHRAFETDYDGGKMDGFNLETLGECATQGPGAGTLPYQYVEESQIQPY